MTKGTEECTGAEQRLCTRIADITVVAITTEPDLRLRAEGARNEFPSDGQNPDVTLRVAWSDLSKVGGGEKLFDAGGLWQLYRVNGSRVFRFFSEAFGRCPYKVARFDPDFTAGEVYLHRSVFRSGSHVDPLEYPLDELLIGNLLARGRGSEVHACGVVGPSGKGYLFAGQSGAGKTTLAKLFQRVEGVKVLSDDRIILRSLGGRLWMYGTPWHGEAGLSSPDRAPLVHVFFLQHGHENGLVPQRRAAALERLFACSFPPFYNPEALEFTLGFLERVVRAVPCSEFRFVPDEGAVEFINELKV